MAKLAHFDKHKIIDSHQHEDHLIIISIGRLRLLHGPVYD